MMTSLFTLLYTKLLLVVVVVVVVVMVIGLSGVQFRE